MPNTTQYFNKNKATKDGLETKCKDCMKIVKLKRYKNVIYEIYCIQTNMYYIGQTIKPLNDRISKHFSDAKRGRKQKLYEDIRKYGREMFSYKQIEEVENKDDLDNRERFWIDKYIKDGFSLYNIEFGGKKDIKIPYETRIRMARGKGTKPFVVYDINKNFLGRFEKLDDANNKLGATFLNENLRKGNPSHGLIAIYENEFSDEKLSKIIDNLIVCSDGKIRRKRKPSINNIIRKNGHHFYVFNSNMELYKEYFSHSACYNELKIHPHTIKKYIDANIPCKKGYYFYTSH